MRVIFEGHREDAARTCNRANYPGWVSSAVIESPLSSALTSGAWTGSSEDSRDRFEGRLGQSRRIIEASPSELRSAAERDRKACDARRKRPRALSLYRSLRRGEESRIDFNPASKHAGIRPRSPREIDRVRARKGFRSHSSAPRIHHRAASRLAASFRRRAHRRSRRIQRRRFTTVAARAAN